MSFAWPLSSSTRSRKEPLDMWHAQIILYPACLFCQSADSMEAPKVSVIIYSHILLLLAESVFILPLPPDTFAEGVMFSDCPSAVFVCSSGQILLL